MNSRAIASIALGAAIILGTTGCSLIAPQATTIEYAAAEGINVPNQSGPVAVRNAFFVVGEGDQANLVAAFVNTTDEDQQALVAVEGGEEKVIEVPAGDTVSFGVDEHKTFSNFTSPIGSTVKVSFTSGSDGQTTTVAVPVLDGSLSYLEDSVPTPTSEATPAS